MRTRAFFIALVYHLLRLSARSGVDRCQRPSYADHHREEGMPQDRRCAWFEEARFGMFIHWGLYSLLGRGEWAMFFERIPKEEYARLAERFSPERFDPGAWASLAKRAGMNYMVLTTRHHDGFCLFDSRVSDFTSTRTAAKRDFVAEYVSACRKAGLRVGLYYSLLDWRFPGYFDPKGQPESAREMVDQVHAQVQELMSNYGKIDYLFYDGEWVPGIEYHRSLAESTKESPSIAEFWRSRELNQMVRRLQPEIVINNRSGLAEDVDTPEQYVVASPPGRLWESCMTIGDYWGYHRWENEFKSSARLVRTLASSVSGGGNFLLNVGPKPDGTVQREQVERLEDVGSWLAVNGEAIYGCGRPPEGMNARYLGCLTARGKTVYLHIHAWPGTEAVFVSETVRFSRAKILSGNVEVAVRHEKPGRVILSGLPPEPPDPKATVIALTIAGG